MQTKHIPFRFTSGVAMSMALACIGGVTLVSPSAVYAQDRRDDHRDDHRDDRRTGHRDDRPDDRRDMHAERRRARDERHVEFTRSAEERRFDNGVVLHRSVAHVDSRFDVFFPHHVYSYPHYALTRASGRAVVSPFGFYVGIFPPYIDRTAVVFSAPSRVYIDLPVYVRGDYQYNPSGYYLDRRGDDERWKEDRDLRDTVYDLEDTFRNEDIGLLAPLTDPHSDIAIFSRGRYQYSLNPNDYLDMTRDFLRAVHTVEFTAYRVHRRAPGVYQVFARHVYREQDGDEKTVYQVIVLEQLHNRWTITQIDSSPAHITN